MSSWALAILSICFNILPCMPKTENFDDYAGESSFARGSEPLYPCPRPSREESSLIDSTSYTCTSSGDFSLPGSCRLFLHCSSSRGNAVIGCCPSTNWHFDESMQGCIDIKWSSCSDSSKFVSGKHYGSGYDKSYPSPAKVNGNRNHESYLDTYKEQSSYTPYNGNNAPAYGYQSASYTPAQKEGTDDGDEDDEEDYPGDDVKVVIEQAVTDNKGNSLTRTNEDGLEGVGKGVAGTSDKDTGQGQVNEDLNLDLMRRLAYVKEGFDVGGNKGKPGGHGYKEEGDHKQPDKGRDGNGQAVNTQGGGKDVGDNDKKHHLIGSGKHHHEGEKGHHEGSRHHHGGAEHRHGGDKHKHEGEEHKHKNGENILGDDKTKHLSDEKEKNDKTTSSKEQKGREQEKSESNRNETDGGVRGESGTIKGNKEESVAPNHQSKTGDDKDKIIGDQDKSVGDKDKHGGEKEKSGGDKDKHGGEKEKSGGDKDKHGGDKDKSGGDKDKHGGEKEKSGGDKDKHGGEKEKSGGDKDKHGGEKEKSGGDKDKHAGDKEKSGGDKDKHIGDKEKLSGDKDKHEGDDKSGGDKDKHGGDKDKHGGDKDKHGGDKDKHGGDKDKPGGDKDKHGGDKEKSGSDKDKHGGDNDKSGTDKDKPGGGRDTSSIDSASFRTSTTRALLFRVGNFSGPQTTTVRTVAGFPSSETISTSLTTTSSPLVNTSISPVPSGFPTTTEKLDKQIQTSSEDQTMETTSSTPFSLDFVALNLFKRDVNSTGVSKQLQNSNRALNVKLEGPPHKFLRSHNSTRRKRKKKHRPLNPLGNSASNTPRKEHSLLKSEVFTKINAL